MRATTLTYCYLTTEILVQLVPEQSSQRKLCFGAIAVPSARWDCIISKGKACGALRLIQYALSKHNNVNILAITRKLKASPSSQRALNDIALTEDGALGSWGTLGISWIQQVISHYPLTPSSRPSVHPLTATWGGAGVASVLINSQIYHQLRSFFTVDLQILHWFDF